MKSIIYSFIFLPLCLVLQNRMDGLYFEANTADPSTFKFDGNELVAQTDSILHFGFQYTSYYDIENVNDSIFMLRFNRQYSRDNNYPKMNKRRHKIKNGRSFWFQIDKYNYWTFKKQKDETLKLIGYALEENQFTKKMEIALVSTKPKLQ